VDVTSLQIEDQVEQARAGNKAALQIVIESIQDRIYGLALRMLWHPEDARDATQEILIRIVTHLGEFRRESAFTTWMYRIAANYLITARKGRIEEQGYSFERFGRELDDGLSDAAIGAEATAEEILLFQEIRVGCTLGMLLCLERPERFAYILGEIMELSGREAAEVLEIEPAAFRQRLVRSRRKILDFMIAKCGLVNPDNPCRCRRRAKSALSSKRVDPLQPLFANDAEQAQRFPKLLTIIRSLQNAQRAVAIYRSQPEQLAPATIAAEIRNLIERITPG
jgi:RNA polymerase sigma factor (sigma-70 family)